MNDLFRMTPERYRDASARSARTADAYEHLLAAALGLFAEMSGPDIEEAAGALLIEIERLGQMAEEQRADAEHFRVLAAALELERRVQ